jgi:hypothetical protein
MPVQDTMESLTTVASSNYPSGSDNIGNTLDDYLRAIQAILRRTEAQGAALTSTASMSLAAATGGYVHITGTDAITHLGTAAPGVLRTLVFDDAATLTHDGTALILPGAANVTTAAGDVAIFRSEGSGNWRCIGYTKADGQALVSAAGGATMTALLVLTTATISALTVVSKATISALTVLGTTTLSAVSVLGPATFSTIAVLKTAVFNAEVSRGTFSTTTTIDWTAGNKQTVTLGASLTFNFTAPPGACNLILKLVQDAAGSRNPGWPGTVKWPAGTEPTWSTAGGSIDVASFYYDGTSYYGAGLIGFA